MSTNKLTTEEINLLGKVLAPKGPRYRDDVIVSYSYYDDPVDTSEDRVGGHGNSRRAGDATPEIQLANMQALIRAGETKGLSSHDIAYVLAIANVESGFNHDAAAETTSASGLGQFIDSTGEAYGLNDDNRWDSEAQAEALVDFYLFNKNLAQNRDVGEEYIYKYHHDGPNPSSDSGGLEIALERVIPKIADYEEFLLFGPIYPDDLPPDAGDWYYFPDLPVVQTPEWVQGLVGSFGSAEVAGSPLVIDVDGDGVELSALGGPGTVSWDIDQDGFREASGWIAGGDGLLALDRNGNHRVRTLSFRLG